MGVSGDGDSASIGLGSSPSHAPQRNMTYIVMNNGVYGLTKGQFSATADKGSISRRRRQLRRIDRPCVARHPDGATFVGRSFSGDKQQLVPLSRLR